MNTPLSQKVFLFLLLLCTYHIVGLAQQKQESATPIFVLKGNTRSTTGATIEGVNIELKKNGKSIAKVVSGKLGKYFIQIDVSTTNPQNECILYITKQGYVPKSLSINSYVPKDEYETNKFPRYDFTLDIKMIAIENKSMGIEKLEQPSGEIKWDSSQKGFAFDQNYKSLQADNEPNESGMTPKPQGAVLLEVKGQTSLSTRKKGLGINHAVNSVGFREDPLEEVSIQVKKNNISIFKSTSGKKGAYSFQLPVSTTNSNNDYIVYISGAGIAPRMIYVNAYLSKDEFKKYSSAKYECELPIILYETSVTDIVLDKPNTKIKWDNLTKHAFVIDPVYEKNASGEENKMRMNSDQFFSNLAKKQKKSASTAKNASADSVWKANAEAKKRAEEEARLLAQMRDKTVADNLDAMKQEMELKHLADSIASLSGKNNHRQSGSTPSQGQRKDAETKNNQASAQNRSASSNRVIVVSPGVSAVNYNGDTVNIIDVRDQKQGRWINFGEEFHDNEYASDAKYFEGTFKNDQRVKDWVKYYPNDKVAARLDFEDGKFTGNYKFFYENGSLFQERFRDMKFNMVNDKFREYTSEGELRKEFQYDSNKQRSGLQFVYYNNGVAAIISNMSNDTLNGYTNYFLEDGQSYLQQLYNNGILKGEKYFGYKNPFPVKLKEAFKQLLSRSDSEAGEKLNTILSEISQTDSQYRALLLQREDDLQSAHLLLAQKEKEILVARNKLSRSEMENQLQSAEVNKQKVITFSSLAVIGLMVFFVFFVIKNSREKTKINAVLHQQKEEIAEKNKDITDSINYARRIQRAMLPHRRDIWAAFPNSFVLFKPKDIVSGDFYFFHENNKSFLIAAADCTGHGVPGAFMSMIASEKLKDAVLFSLNISDVLSHLNKGIKTSLRQYDGDDSTKDGMDIALCSVDIDNKIVKYAGANRPIWIIRKGQTEIEEIKATKKAIAGFTEDSQHFNTHEIKLQEGDTFYIFSDGYADLFGMTGKKLTTKKFKQILIEIQNRPMKDQEKYLEDFAENWRSGTEQIDDVLVIGVRM